jgi:hypothetical protein
VKCILCLSLALAAQAQTTASLQLGSQSTTGTAFSLNLTLTSNGAPAGLQWTLRFVPGTVVTLAPVVGPSGTAAAKSLTCNTSLAQGTSVCILAGLNTTTIANGVVTVISGTLPAGQNNHVGFNVTDALAVDAPGNSIPATATGGFVDQLSSGVTVPLTYLRATQLGRGITLQNGQLSVVQGGNEGLRGPAGPAGPGTAINFMDDDTAAVINLDGTVKLSAVPNPVSSVHVALNGVVLKRDVDFVVSGQVLTLTYLPPVPANGDFLVISYRF